MSKSHKNWLNKMAADAQSNAKKKGAGRQGAHYEDLTWVQCKDFRCLAYTDQTGKRINFYTGKPLTDFIKVIG
jgi:hypothetical protein